MMKHATIVCLSLLVISSMAWAKTATYNEATLINLRQQGIPADEKSYMTVWDPETCDQH